MNSQIRISLALLFSAWMAASACGQFPWSGGKDAAAEGHKTGSITWKSDLPEALKLAREQRKLVFLHFSGTHCPPCRKLEDNVLNRNDVAVTMLSRFVPVFIVVEQAENLVERFHVQSWPTDVILDADGREIARHVSPQNPQEFIKRISSISAKHHAGQSTTLANVRAAVASDVTESSGPVQQTAADERLATPTQPPRAESKIVRNPHTPDSRLPPIVARNNKAKKATVPSGDREEEGFSPPSERRKPVIVRKADEPKQFAALDKSEEEPGDTELANDEPAAEANVEGDVAPWRKNLIAKKAAKQVEVAKEPDAEEVPAEEPAEEMETAPDEAAAEKTEEPAAETGSEPRSEKTAPEKTATAEEEPVADANKSEKPVEQEVTDELPAPRSRFGATKAEESPAEEETPAPEQTAEAPAKSEEEAPEETEVPKTPETTSEEPAPKEKATKPEAVAPESKELARPKSRFSGGEDGEAKPAEETPAATESGEPAEEAAGEPDVKQEAVKQEAAPPAEEKTEAETPKAAEENTEAAEATPESEATEEAPAESEEAPVKEAPKKTAPKAVAKKAKKPIEAPSEEPEANADEAAAEPAESARPRGLAKIARSGKYVLGGHCCVTLLENETLKKGNPKLGAIHRGRIYLFSTAEARKKFLDHPDDYSPMLTGYDPVLYADKGELVDGSAEILAKLHDGRVVTFSSEDTYKRFAADYKKLREKSPYVEATRSAMKETNGGRHFR